MVYPKAGDAILVSGATGAQGGAVVRALLARERSVRALVRNPRSPGSLALREAGAELVTGDMEDPASLAAAMQGAAGVFSVQVPDTRGDDSERRHGLALIHAARAAGVAQFVHTSVSGTAQRTSFARWASGYWSQKYWNDKWDVEEAVRRAGFAAWTVLRPAFLMDNFAQPKSAWMFPQLRHGEIATALLAQTRLQLIAADDVGAFAAAAFDDRKAFGSREVDLAAEALTMGEIAGVLARTTDRPIAALSLTPGEALARGLNPGWVRSQEWTNEVGYQADIEGLARWQIPLTSFEVWAQRHRSAIGIPA
ncbi:NmrA family NAD(P)-binding protein [Ramlibacter sp. WS9]|uniref:NmrA family NAD(P)-binding protein n=1 Tax=Ramlibacter sp. WS9 TaxID=1882741 RepID=UPI0011430710|nr:NmrA family NAD(P)-binding protein [Ramlibacter sp. WS9]ROZ69219.1 NAD-dependent epimerase/dehydratase family protein [Ramlibacter sp. WS9]